MAKRRKPPFEEPRHILPIPPYDELTAEQKKGVRKFFETGFFVIHDPVTNRVYSPQDEDVEVWFNGPNISINLPTPSRREWDPREGG